MRNRRIDILRFIEKYITENGYPPTVREIGKGVGLNSTATVQRYLMQLEERGYIERKNSARAIRIIKASIR